jgi:4-hydroxy-tetrahydrodipicolinate reductase
MSIANVIIVGARGRMGTTLIREVMQSDDLVLSAAIDHPDAPGHGRDVGPIAGMPEAGVLLSDRLDPKSGDVVIDFSLPEATEVNLQRCLDVQCPLVLGTTGISEETRENILAASSDIPIVWAANFSAGITMLIELARIAAKSLGTDWNAELFELHHRHKRDAPSGTALRIGSAVASATDRDAASVLEFNRTERRTARAQEEIGVMALRGGDSVGEHTLMFLAEGERLELVHRASDRAIFARGALRAAQWAVGRDPGLYDMADVLGFG